MTRLSHKIWIGVLGSLVVTSVLTSFLVLESEHKTLREELDYSGRTLSRTISAFCVDNLLAYEYPGLADYIRHAAEDSDHVVFIRIYGAEDEGSKVIAQVPDDIETALAGREVATYQAPVIAQIDDLPPEALGQVEVAFSTDRLATLMAENTWRLVVGTIVTFSLLAFVIGLVLRKAVLKPVAQLDREAKRIGSGDLDTPVELSGKDELGRLGLTDNVLSKSYGDVPEHLHDPLDKIRGCANRLWQMTEEILTFSRLVKMESGEDSPVRTERFSLAESLEESFVDLRVTAERKNLELELAFDPELEVECSRRSLEDLLRVFVDNATKYTEEGRVEVLATRWADDSEVQGFQVAVRDTGIGIPADKLESIFEPFVQGFDHETRQHGGVGFGLAIAEKLIDRLGAQVAVESEVGEGTCFTLFVPEEPTEANLEALRVEWPARENLPTPSAPQSPAERPSVEEPTAEQPAAIDPEGASPEGSPAAESVARRADGERFRVLVTDDEPINREVLQGALQKEHEVLLAEHGQQCLDILRSERVDLLVLDIMMPGLSGFDVLEAMGREGRLEDTPVIVLSAKTSPKSIVRGLELGAVDYLGKPFQREELRCRIRTQLKIVEQRHLLEEEVKQKSTALQRAEQANYVKTQFLANMSHEIRTPINGILGFATLGEAEDEMDNEERLELFESIRECTDSLMNVVDDILDMTRIESRKLDFAIEQVQPEPTIEQVCQSHRQSAEEKGLVFEFQCDELAARPIWSNEKRLRQILDNIVSNAIKFTEQGSINVSATVTHNEGYNATFLEVAVRDTGVGVDPEQHEEIFGAFTQADISMSRRYGGTGLGLAISRHMARMLGGNVTIDSGEGEGATFFVRVPTDSRQFCESNAVEESPSPAQVSA